MTLLGFLVTTLELTHGVYSSCVGRRMPARISRSVLLGSWIGICLGGCRTDQGMSWLVST